MLATFYPFDLVLVCEGNAFVTYPSFSDFHISGVTSPHHVRADNDTLVFRTFGRRRIMGTVPINALKYIAIPCISLMGVKSFHSSEQ